LDDVALSYPDSPAPEGDFDASSDLGNIFNRSAGVRAFGDFSSDDLFDIP
jgi:hypothetical protein